MEEVFIVNGKKVTAKEFDAVQDKTHIYINIVVKENDGKEPVGLSD